jgi:formylglycine-generating enzyme required for sulfatase activity/energy-coupling factor transporter ATP-binding protein EcfA2
MSGDVEVQQQIDELRRKLDSLDVLRSDLGEETYAQKQAEIQQQLTLIETQGGVAITGDVKVDRGSKFVGGDDYSVTTTIITAPDLYPPEELLQAYYRALSNECRRLPLGIIDTQFVRTSGEQPVPLPDIYVDLDVIAPAEQRSRAARAWAWRLLSGEGAGRTPLLHAITREGDRRIVLVGDPGSGKSTFVNYLTYLLTTDDPALPEPLRGQLVVRLNLREVLVSSLSLQTGKGMAQMLWNALRAELAARLGDDAADKLLPYLRQRLLKDGGFILLDGLDEVPESQQRRQILLEAVSDWLGLLPADRTRYLITSRPYAYADQRWLLPGFISVVLAPFSAEQVQRFIARWYQAVRASLQWNEATARAKGEQLRLILREQPYLGDLASRPLLLTLMAALHSSWGQLPEDHASLYEETVRLLLGRWQRAREIQNSSGLIISEPGITQTLSVSEDRVRAALEKLAYTVHERQCREAQPDSLPADISEGEVLLAFKPLLRDVDPDELLRYLKYRAGLVVEYDAGVYAFPHRSFQEYLAACYLANQVPLAEELCSVVRDNPLWWREVFVLAVGKFKRSGAGAVVAALNTLLPASPDELDAVADTHWRSAALAGRALIDMRLVDRIGEQPQYDVIVRRVRKWLTQLIENGHLPARERAEAGDVLGQLGDPRFDAQRFYVPRLYRGAPEILFGFVPIEAGSFVMGSRQGDPEADEDELGNPDRLTLPYAYWLARYPASVAQFGAFVAAQGYQDDRWWTPLGREWRAGSWDERYDRSDLPWQIATRPLETRAQPAQWIDQVRYPNRPVVGVTWFEAAAYCAWLNAQLQPDLPQGCVIRLPTEAEWERAARLPLSPRARGEPEGGQRFPWGDDDWDESRANIEAGHLNRPTTVGLYPRGATAAGLLDLGGNVWEWCLSLYRIYPYEPQRYNLNDREAAGERVLRGGSWLFDQRNARCAYRDRFDPDGFYDNVGFRLALAQAADAY